MTSASQTSRRDFLGKTAAAAGGIVAAPYVITSKALGDGTTPPASDRIVMGGMGIESTPPRTVQLTSISVNCWLATTSMPSTSRLPTTGTRS